MRTILYIIFIISISGCKESENTNSSQSIAVDPSCDYFLEKIIPATENKKDDPEDAVAVIAMHWLHGYISGRSKEVMDQSPEVFFALSAATVDFCRKNSDSKISGVAKYIEKFMD